MKRSLLCWLRGVTVVRPRLGGDRLQAWSAWRGSKVMVDLLRIRVPWQWRPGLACGLMAGGLSARVAWAMVGVAGILVTGVLQSPVGWGIYDCSSHSC